MLRSRSRRSSSIKASSSSSMTPTARAPILTKRNLPVLMKLSCRVVLRMPRRSSTSCFRKIRFPTIMGSFRLHRETFRDLGDGEEFDWIVAVTPATDMVEGSSRLISRSLPGWVRRELCRPPHLAETMACSTFGETRAKHRANAVNDLNVQNRGDYFSAIFGLALGGRPRLTSTRHDPRNAARRYSRPPRMPAFFAAASRPRRVGDLPAACSEFM